MPRYHLRFMKGPNYTLNLEFEAVVEALSFEEALKPHTDWPITESYDHATATAWNPGTCMYYQEMWVMRPTASFHTRANSRRPGSSSCT